MRLRAAGFVLAGLALAGGLQAQEADVPGPGDLAPDFTLPVGTRDGVSKEAVSLMDFRGQSVVLAFFYKARTGG